jgi:hypothetical protein
VGEPVERDGARVVLVTKIGDDVPVGDPAKPGRRVVDAALEPLELFELCLPAACQRRPLGRQGPGAGDVGVVEPDVEVPPLLGELGELGGDGLLRAGPCHAGREGCVGVVGLVDVGVDLVEVLVEEGLVEAVGLPSSRERDVAPLAVERLRAEHVGVLDGEPLGLVAGDRIPMGDVAGVEVGTVEDDRATVVGDRADLPAVRIEMGDGGAGPVDDAEPTMVAQADDPVAGLQLDPAGVEGGAGEAAGGVQAGASTVVEVVHVGPTQPDHDRPGRVVAGGVPPVVDEPLAQVEGAVGGDDAAVGPVGVERDGRVAVAEFVEGSLFPEVGLPSVVGELDGGKPGRQGAVEAAGVDLGQLVRVADQHHLHVGVGGVVQEAGELAGADHPRLSPLRNSGALTWHWRPSSTCSNHRPVLLPAERLAVMTRAEPEPAATQNERSSPRTVVAPPAEGRSGRGPWPLAQRCRYGMLEVAHEF